MAKERKNFGYWLLAWGCWFGATFDARCSINDIRYSSIINRKYVFQKGLMGSEFNVIFYAANDSIAKVASDSVFARIKQLNAILSDYLDGSEVNRLSATSGSGQWVKVSRELFEILAESKVISKKTDGAFDVTIGPIIQMWRRAMRRNYFPENSEIEAAKQKIGWRAIRLNAQNQSVKLTKKGMRLDFGGIGKGYAADEGLKVLQYFGIDAGLIDAGGDLAIGQPPPQKDGWQIEATSVIDSSDKQLLSLKNCGVATSGVAYRFLEHEGKRYSHIVNPRTGVGLLKHTRTTVVAPNGTLADALATAFSVLGKSKSPRVDKRFSGIKVWVLEKE